MKKSYLTLFTLLGIGLLLNIQYSLVSAESSQTITPINDEVSIKKTVIPMYIPEDNEFPWGAIRGQADDLAERYPIIIQIYKEDDPVHFAQVDPKGDGSFEYKFRVRNVDADTGIASNIFEGSYTVKIFRVIPNSSSSI